MNSVTAFFLGVTSGTPRATRKCRKVLFAVSFLLLPYGEPTGKAQAKERNCGLIYLGGNKLRHDPELCPKTL